MDDPSLLLENQICFRVYSLERAIMAAYKPLLAALGLTYPQYLVMLALWEKGESTVGGLCSVLGLDTGTMSPLLKRMESNHLVVRTRLPEDERTVLVRLTAQGIALKERARLIPAQIGSCMFGSEDGFDPESYIQLRETLDRALVALDARKGSLCNTTNPS